MKISEASAATIAVIRSFIGIDENDNLLAHVSLRKAPLAELLLISDAGDAEIAIASDTDSIVVYKDRDDLTSKGLSYRRPAFIGSFRTASGSFVIPTGEVETQLIIDTVISETEPYVDIADNSFVAGNLIHETESRQGFFADLTVKVKGVVPALAGTYVKAEIESFVSASYQKTDASLVLPIIPISGVNPIYTFNFKELFLSSASKFKIMLSTDDPVAFGIPASVDMFCQYSNVAGDGYSVE